MGLKTTQQNSARSRDAIVQYFSVMWWLSPDEFWKFWQIPAAEIHFCQGFFPSLSPGMLLACEGIKQKLAAHGIVSSLSKVIQVNCGSRLGT